MSDVFISYRRSGGDLDWAGRIRDALVKDFAVFFDTHIEPAGSIRANIEDALKRCRVVIPVIGPGWMAEKARLFNEEDWVRKELLTALQRGPSVHVLPLRRKEVQFPRAQDLARDYPKELWGLFDKKAVELSHDNWDAEITQLKQELRSMLAGTQRAMTSRGAVSLHLPYLCDRVEQEYELGEQLQSAGTADPLVCVTYGSKPEEHMRFFERLEYTSILDELFGSGDLRPSVHRLLDWNRGLIKAGRFGDLLRQSIKRKALNSLSASDDQLLQFLQTPGCARIFVLIITEEDLKEHGFELLERLTRAWRDLFVTPAPAGEKASCFTPSHPMVLWLNVFHAGDELPWRPEPPSIMLPVLKPLVEDDVMRWAEREEVRPHIEGREAEVQAILTNESCIPGKGKAHMDFFAREVQRILRQS